MDLACLLLFDRLKNTKRGLRRALTFRVEWIVSRVVLPPSLAVWMMTRSIGDLGLWTVPIIMGQEQCVEGGVMDLSECSRWQSLGRN